MWVPHVEDSLHFGPQLDLTHWISPGSVPLPPGMWVLGNGHTPGRGLSPKQPQGWLGVCSTEWTHGAGCWGLG